MEDVNIYSFEWSSNVKLSKLKKEIKRVMAMGATHVEIWAVSHHGDDEDFVNFRCYQKDGDDPKARKAIIDGERAAVLHQQIFLRRAELERLEGEHEAIIAAYQ